MSRTIWNESDSIGAFLQLHNDKSLYALTNHHVVVRMLKNTVKVYGEARKPLVAASRIKLTILLIENPQASPAEFSSKGRREGERTKKVVTRTITRRIYLQGRLNLELGWCAQGCLRSIELMNWQIWISSGGILSTWWEIYFSAKSITAQGFKLYMRQGLSFHSLIETTQQMFALWTRPLYAFMRAELVSTGYDSDFRTFSFVC